MRDKVGVFAVETCCQLTIADADDQGAVVAQAEAVDVVTHDGVREPASCRQVRTRPKRPIARIVATDTPERWASSGRDIPAVGRRSFNVVSVVAKA